MPRRVTREDLLSKWGHRCFICGTSGSTSNPLEFAHKRPTSLKGRGRGQKERVRDVLLHPFSYVLLCWKCHRWYDR